MAFNYEDIKCPHCGESERVRFTVESTPFGSTEIVAEKPKKCFHCQKYYKPKVETIYSSRKLNRLEKQRLGIAE